MTESIRTRTTAIEDRLVAEARQAVISAKSRSANWAHHPTYDTRRELRVAWIEALAIVAVVGRVLSAPLGGWTGDLLRERAGIDIDACWEWQAALEESRSAWELRDRINGLPSRVTTD